jgi:hypothetical protein
MLLKFKKEALVELIEERLAAGGQARRHRDQRRGSQTRHEGIAERNKLTEEQFTQQIKGPVSTLRPCAEDEGAICVARDGCASAARADLDQQRDVERMRSSGQRGRRGHHRAGCKGSRCRRQRR